MIAVLDVNEFPISSVTDANGSINTIAENSAAGTLTGIRASATDADGSMNTVTWSLLDSAGGRFTIDSVSGIVTVAGSSLIDYETAGSHTIIVRGSSADGSTSSQSFTITVTNVNEAATAVDLTFNGLQVSGVTGTPGALLAGAADPENTSLSIVLVNGPVNGTVTVQSDGSFRYVPTGAFSGVDSFSWYVTDGLLNSNTVTATVIIAVSAPGGGTGGTDAGAGGGSDAGTGPIDSRTGTGTGGLISDSTGGSVTVSDPGNVISTPTAPQSPSGNTTETALVMPHEPLVSSTERLGIDVSPTVDAGTASMSAGWLVSVALDAVPEPARLGIRAGLNGMLSGNDGVETVRGGLIGWIAPTDAIVLPDLLVIDNSSYTDTTKNQHTVMLSAENVVLGTTTVVSISVSIGDVVWMLRGGSLLTAFVSSLPAWRAFHPLPILNSFDTKEDEKDNDTLLSIATGSKNPSDTTEDRPADQPLKSSPRPLESCLGWSA